jgi:hypothetical protein
LKDDFYKTRGGTEPWIAEQMRNRNHDHHSNEGTPLTIEQEEGENRETMNHKISDINHGPQSTRRIEINLFFCGGTS